MRILIDLQGAQNNSRDRGIGRYSLALAKAIARNRGGHEVFILLSNLFPETLAQIKNLFTNLLPPEHFVYFSACGPTNYYSETNSWRNEVAELLYEKLINDLQPDIFLISSLFEGGQDNTITSIGKLFPKVQTAVILYDLIPYLDPEKYLSWKPAKDWYTKKIDYLKRTDLLLAISYSAENEAIDHLGVIPTRVRNISAAVDEAFVPGTLTAEEARGLRKKYGIQQRYLMHSGAFDERKNFEGLIEAFSLIPKDSRKDVQLVLVCKIDEPERAKLRNLATTFGLKNDDLILTGFISDKELIGLYTECYLFVFPSFHEGFGLPVLEAMSCGAPVIGSNSSSIPEVIGRSDALFDPKSANEMAKLIEKVLIDTSFRESLKAHAVNRCKSFNWDKCAQTAIDSFEKLPINNISGRIGSKKTEIIELMDRISRLNVKVEPSEQDFIETAEAVYKNEIGVSRLKGLAAFGGQLKWRVEGPFDSSYSLALLNRETARALEQLGHFVVLHSTEGPGDYSANTEFLSLHSDIRVMHSRVTEYPQTRVDVTSRNLYPPRVTGMHSRLNLLHHYAWEESGFPQNWVNDFNENLNGITCLSNHVEKILIDNGVSIPLTTSGCGVDHWMHISPARNYQIIAKQFRFLHVSSCFPRKGADLLLDAYALAFTWDDEVTLVIKTFPNPHNNIAQLIAERKKENPKFPDVLVISEDITESELKSLYQQCHVLVAPSKAEGFGLPMAEAMLSGLPVITTAWGGQLDFCNEDNSWLVDYEFERASTHFELFDSVWAKVSIDKLVLALIDARNSTPEQLTLKATAGRSRLLENFRWTDVVSNAIEAAHELKQSIIHKPDVKIGWLTTWNTKCGIATYSEHLTSNIDTNVFILAPDQENLVHVDKSNCVRCWSIGKERNEFRRAEQYIRENNLNVIIIQFNYGFFNHIELFEFIKAQVNENRIIIITMHSTVDPVNSVPSWNFRLEELHDALNLCNRILVHSVADLNRLKSIGLVENVTLFPHGVLNYPFTRELRVISRDLPLIASYGFCLPHKGLVELVEAAGLLKAKGHPVRLRLVNAEYPVSDSASLVTQLKVLIEKLGIADLVEMHTAFLDDKDSLALLSEADMLVFAYQKTGESASGAVRYGLATRRPVAITPIAIFEDIGSAAFHFAGTSSEDIALGILEYLKELSLNTEKAQRIARTAAKWRDQHDYSAVGKRLSNICSALLLKHAPRTYRFQGSSPMLRTVVGDVQGSSIISTNTAGNLVHGPYIALPSGAYRVIIRGTFGEKGIEGASMDVVGNNGNYIFGRAILAEPTFENCLVTLPILLSDDCSELEVRVWVSVETELSVSMIEIESLTKSWGVSNLTSFGVHTQVAEDIALDHYPQVSPNGPRDTALDLSLLNDEARGAANVMSIPSQGAKYSGLILEATDLSSDVISLPASPTGELTFPKSIKSSSKYQSKLKRNKKR
jgi:O-antigen biosynthesis alpha-1,2-mannosyltransferase